MMAGRIIGGTMLVLLFGGMLAVMVLGMIGVIK